MRAILISRLLAASLVGTVLGGCVNHKAVDADVSAAPPSARTMMEWIAHIEAQGVRRPGYEADDQVERWLRDRFVEAGLQDVTLDPIEVLRWEPQRWSLSVWHDGDEAHAVEIASWPVPLSAEAHDLEGELVLSPKPHAAEAGRIAVVDLDLLTAPQARVRDDLATWAYDPAGEFDTLSQTWPLGPRFSDVMEPDIAMGAKAFIGILDFPWQTGRYYVPYDAKPRSIPGLYLSRADGEVLKAFIAQGPAHARITLQREQRTATSHNVIGVLPGRSEEWVVIGSHHDGPWASAVEDASGTALVLAQAHYWSQVPRAQRPHNLMFLLNGGHMSGGAGLIHFAKTRKAFLEGQVVSEIHLEHAAREAAVVDGQLVPTDRPEVRWWFTSFIPQLEESVARAICGERLERSLMMPVEGFPAPTSKHPPTDAAFFHPLAPIVSFLTAPMYLFDPADSLAMVHEESLVPITRAVISIIGDLGRTTAADLRKGVYARPRSGALPSCEALTRPSADPAAKPPDTAG